jgi:hypothetical protein
MLVASVTHVNVLVPPLSSLSMFVAMRRHIEPAEHLPSDQRGMRHGVRDIELGSLIGRRGQFTFAEVKSNDCETMTFMISLEPP